MNLSPEERAAFQGGELSDDILGGAGGAIKEEYIVAFTDDMYGWPVAPYKVLCPECFAKGKMVADTIIACNRAGKVVAFRCPKCGFNFICNH